MRTFSVGCVGAQTALSPTSTNNLGNPNMADTPITKADLPTAQDAWSRTLDCCLPEIYALIKKAIDEQKVVAEVPGDLVHLIPHLSGHLPDGYRACGWGEPVKWHIVWSPRDDELKPLPSVEEARSAARANAIRPIYKAIRESIDSGRPSCNIHGPTHLFPLSEKELPPGYRQEKECTWWTISWDQEACDDPSNGAADEKTAKEKQSLPTAADAASISRETAIQGIYKEILCCIKKGAGKCRVPDAYCHAIPLSPEELPAGYRQKKGKYSCKISWSQKAHADSSENTAPAATTDNTMKTLPIPSADELHATARAAAVEAIRKEVVRHANMGEASYDVRYMYEHALPLAADELPLGCIQEKNSIFWRIAWDKKNSTPSDAAEPVD